MGMYDKIKHTKDHVGESASGVKDRALGMLHDHSDQLGKGLDKAKQAVDKPARHKYSERINSGVGKAKDRLGGHRTGPASTGAQPPQRPED
jgi:negative regulator of replication initiation